MFNWVQTSTSFFHRSFILALIDDRFEDMLQDIFIDSVIFEEAFVFEVEFLVTNQFNKRIRNTPRMRLFHNQALNNNSN